jgi:hypothetical protein
MEKKISGPVKLAIRKRNFMSKLILVVGAFLFSMPWQANAGMVVQEYDGVYKNFLTFPILEMDGQKKKVSKLDFWLTIDGQDELQPIKFKFQKNDGSFKLFEYTVGNCYGVFSPQTNESKASACLMIIDFTPFKSGLHTEYFEITYRNLRTNQVEVSVIELKANAADNSDYGHIETESPKIDFGLVKKKKTVEKTITLRNRGGRAIEASVSVPQAFRFKGASYPGVGGTCGQVIAGYETCTIVIEFSPPKKGDYSGDFFIHYYPALQSKETVSRIAFIGKGF